MSAREGALDLGQYGVPATGFHTQSILPSESYGGAVAGLGFGLETTEIPLDPDVLNSLCRRSRRRLRDIQVTCQADMVLDRTRSVLRVTGTQQSIQAVQKQLENLGGPYKPLAAAVWAELMRTRTLRHCPQATLARLQQESGCRIHIERTRQEARLFGSQEAVAAAGRLLDALAESCAEDTVPVADHTSLSSSVLQALAHESSVTFRVEEGRIVVLGLKSHVAEAVKELHKYLIDPSQYKAPLMPESREPMGEMAIGVAKSSAITQKSQMGMASGSTHMGSSTTTTQPTSALGYAFQPDTFTCKNIQGGKPTHDPNKGARHSNSGCTFCPTCGAGRFCHSCGTMCWQFDPGSFMQAGGYTLLAAPTEDVCKRAKGVEAEVSKREQPGLRHLQFVPYGGKMPPAGMVPVCFPAGVPGQAGDGHQPVMQTYLVPAVGMAPWAGH